MSLPGARYFVTICTERRQPVLTIHGTASHLVAILNSLHTQQDVTFLCATLMPDHAPLLFALGNRLRLGQIMAKLKTLARHSGRTPWRWQEDGFEHRLRPNESIEDYGLYIFMNPYRAGLIPMSKSWPWWFCPEPSQFRFLEHLNPDGSPPPEWLREVDAVKARIITS